MHAKMHEHNKQIHNTHAVLCVYFVVDSFATQTHVESAREHRQEYILFTDCDHFADAHRPIHIHNPRVFHLAPDDDYDGRRRR